MSTVENGNEVKIHYTGTLDDGTVFDSSEGREPLEFKVGDGRVIPGFEKGVMGMAVGESKKINIPAEEAYGEYSEELKLNAPRAHFPKDVELQNGLQFQLQEDNGQSIMATVVGFTDTHVYLDANHPLAGKALNFELKLDAIK
ncbi:MAG: peptidylprolyl isomerase [bacterium]|nr:peptidylprolyl isomerase [bacterium]